MGTPSLWQEQHPGRRYPALEGSHRGEVCVVGAGVTGAACAWRLLEHGLAVTVLEARSPAAAASGRNGGFAVAGTALEHDRLEQRLGAGRAARLHRATERSLAAMAELAAELRVPDTVRRRGCLWVADQHEAAEMAQAVSSLRAAGVEVQDADGRVPAAMRGWVAAAAFLPGDAELLPARWVHALTAACAERGAAVFERSPVRAIDREGEGWRVTAGAGELRADAVVVACDGLTGRLLPQLAGAVYPVRGQIAATEPLAEVPLDGPAHSQFGFMYYRPTDDGRVLVGGGRLEHLEQEYTDREQTTAAVQAQLDRFLRDRLGLGDARVTHRWAGIMGFSADLLPLAGRVTGDGGLYVAGGYSGVGNVLGHHCGGLVADLIAPGSHADADVFDPARLADAGPDDRIEQRASRALAARLGLAGAGR